jgi:hypothetical protein
VRVCGGAFLWSLTHVRARVCVTAEIDQSNIIASKRRRTPVQNLAEVDDEEDEEDDDE